MRILSVDVGTKNLAVCNIDTSTNQLHLWQVSSIVGRDLLDGVYAALTGLGPELLCFDVALVEKQPTNRKMIRVESMIAMYLRSRCREGASVLLYSPVHKLKGVDGSHAARGVGRQAYAARKALSVAEASRWLSEHPQPQQQGASNFEACFHAARKKDDFADSLLQALSFEACAAGKSSSSSKPVRARQPTDKQRKKRAFSLPNLKWLMQNALQDRAGVVDCFEEVGGSGTAAVGNRLLADRDVCAALERHGLSVDSALSMFGMVS